MNLLADIERDIDRDWREIQIEVNSNGRKSFYGSVFEVLDKLIYLNKKNRKMFEKENYGRDGYASYLREFCTVTFDIGRSTGKTEYIKQSLEENDVVIVMNGHCYKRFLHPFRYKSEFDFDFDIFNYSKLKDLGFRKMNNQAKTIYVDNANYISDVDRDFYFRIYTLFGNYDIDQTFVFLG